MAEAVLNNIEFQKLLHEKRKFDLIIAECYFPVLYSLTRRFGAPVVVISSFGLITAQHDLMGNPNHPVLYPDLLLGLTGQELSFWQKVKSVLFTVWSIYYHYYYSLPNTHKMALQYFGDDIPYLENLEKNISLLYSQENPLFHSLRPKVPSIKNLGQLHLKPTKPLPKDLQEILDAAKERVVYFSLGSNIQSVGLDKKLLEIITSALSELPYQVVWKWESDFLPNKPSNVIIRKWLPQQDLLAHPNICVFVTQGGLQSTEEAVSREVPIVGLPFSSDQPVNTKRMMELGVGISLDHKTLTREKLKNSIIEICENSSYKKRIKEVRKLFLDREITSMEKFVWWSEHVIRHRGARHLRSPSADIFWMDYLMLDVFCIFVVAVSVVIYLCYFVKVVGASNITPK